MLQIANNPRKRAKRFWGLFCGGCGEKSKEMIYKLPL